MTGDGASPDSGAVDAHVHLWDLDRVELSWFRPGLGLPRAANVRDLAEASRAATTPVGPVSGVVAVQAADTREEARWLAGLSDPLLAGVVLQYEPGDPSGAARSAVGARVRGVRVAVPDRRADLADVPGLDALCERVAAAAGVVEFLVRSEQLPAVAAVAARHPATRIVVCHLGLGAAEPGSDWEAGLRAVAAHPSVAAKASGQIGERDPDDGRLRRALAVAVDAFGAHRLLFGSDWPMSARVAPYAEVVARTAAALPALGPGGSSAFWGGTARALYRL
ncbi:amidohydrolase [Leifsonia sp. LS1]|uniref:amidohydrolase family protein n=1 Tax=Leifsonia sp. LS1 TaxID=2828483 RepID=UPI001CFCB02C|nr:amidohydrolase family protein [Leifsonia sp. LS1]GIT79697.1 amidohydrolase [Leifsonia sp. LS1]